ncbi:hypothetical protein [Flavobacterium sp.]|uniref:hypothetical protein n=1 Tax=Flavobacterium sp. TaxID=239 RepID=UPI0040474F34
MKKIVLCAFALTVFSAANAQESVSYKPTTGTVTTEVGLIGGLNNANFNLNGGALKFRYFLKEDLGLRLGLAVNNEKNEGDGTDTYSDFNSPISVSGTKTTVVNTNTLKIGVEKHFAGSNRLSTYGGADLMVGFGKNNSEVVAENGNYLKREGNSSSFGVALFTGADYYIAEKVFLGVEAGLNFLSSKVKDKDVSGKFGNNEESDTVNGSKNSKFETNVFGGIRIGYQF